MSNKYVERVGIAYPREREVDLILNLEPAGTALRCVLCLRVSPGASAGISRTQHPRRE